MKVYMPFKREKLIEIISLFGYKKNHLKQFSNNELFNLGLKEGCWTGKPMKIEEQQKLIL